ncbi:hypothetical protein B0H63DRAFT_536760 [Podospora didyma]|uniref:Transmembrane protein n=1 Tax=Podospora didyma TaxID=330526 RepID=A0AAE0JZ23_9PEZI|nr:hypothetical protein B0H63DRAFT_536760 [Podospora didyma]
MGGAVDDKVAANDDKSPHLLPPFRRMSPFHVDMPPPPPQEQKNLWPKPLYIPDRPAPSTARLVGGQSPGTRLSRLGTKLLALQVSHSGSGLAWLLLLGFLIITGSFTREDALGSGEMAALVVGSLCMGAGVAGLLRSILSGGLHNHEVWQQLVLNTLAGVTAAVVCIYCIHGGCWCAAAIATVVAEVSVLMLTAADCLVTRTRRKWPRAKKAPARPPGQTHTDIHTGVRGRAQRRSWGRW